MSETQRKAYRYVVTEASETMADKTPPGSFVLDWKYLGPIYTWHVYDFAGKEPTLSGWWTGRYVDKGAVVDGRYAPVPGETT